MYYEADNKFCFFYGIIINVKRGWQISNATVLNATDRKGRIDHERGEKYGNRKQIV